VEEPFFGAILYGRLADLVSREKIYGLEAAIMLVFALASAAAPSFVALVAFRFILGLGIGGDYPVSAVLMSEYSNRINRGRLVGLVFAMQALGTLAGYAAGLTLLSAGISHDVVWRLVLGLGALPSAGVLYARRRMPESPRFQAWVQGDEHKAAESLATYSGGTFAVATNGDAPTSLRMSLSQFISDRRLMLTLLGTTALALKVRCPRCRLVVRTRAAFAPPYCPRCLAFRHVAVELEPVVSPAEVGISTPTDAR
jgi:MFS transporter, PHS family, inorganic phosphate transporter